MVLRYVFPSSDLAQGANVQVHRDRVYIFEEYCEGGSLANLLEHGRVEEEDVVTVYAIQMLQGLAYLHGKGIEHRDVKPDSTSFSQAHGENLTLRYLTWPQLADQICRFRSCQSYCKRQQDDRPYKSHQSHQSSWDRCSWSR
jgi:serine/threonine protein kinase